MVRAEHPDSATTVPAPMRLSGLDPDRRSAVSVLDDVETAGMADRTSAAWCPASLDTPIGGGQLIERGLQMPILHPVSVLLVDVKVVW